MKSHPITLLSHEITRFHSIDYSINYCLLVCYVKIIKYFAFGLIFRGWDIQMYKKAACKSLIGVNKLLQVRKY
jgi:hypothetical protein